MNIDSIKAGRLMQTRNFIVGVTNSDQVVMQGDSRRVALFIQSSNAAALTVTFGKAAVNGVGIFLPGNTQMFRITIDEYGNSITQDVHAILGAAGPANVMFTDVILLEN